MQCGRIESATVALEVFTYARLSSPKINKMVGFSKRAHQAKLKAQLIKEGKIPRTRAPNKKKQLSPGSQHLINYLSIVKPKKTKKQLKEEENLRLELYFNEKKRLWEEEAAKATASNTQASSGDSDQTAAGSCTAPVNSNTETMATD